MQPLVTDIASADWRIQILGALVTALTGVLTVGIPLLVRLGLRYLEKRLHIETTAADEERLIRAAQQGVDFAEEQARKRLKVGGSPLSSQDKLDLAAGYVQDVLARHGVDRMTQAEIERVVEAVLTRRRGA